MNLLLPQCVTMPSQFRNERVMLGATEQVSFLNIAWILSHLTVRLKCIVYSKGKIVQEIENSSGLPFKEATDIVTCKAHDSIVIRHGANNVLGGVTLKRIDDVSWVMDTLPAVTMVRGFGEVQEINHICRELFLSIKHATKQDGGLVGFPTTYRQPIYYHPRFDNKDFDPSYFTVD